MAIPPNVKQLFTEWGRKGGRKRKQRLTSARRKEIARKAAQARWAAASAEDRRRFGARLAEARRKKRKAPKTKG